MKTMFRMKAQAVVVSMSIVLVLGGWASFAASPAMGAGPNENRKAPSARPKNARPAGIPNGVRPAVPGNLEASDVDAPILELEPVSEGFFFFTALTFRLPIASSWTRTG